MIRRLINTLREASDVVALASAKDKAKREQHNAALSFNNLHAYNRFGRQEWMCPTCNKVHPREEKISALTGYQYPMCCQFPDGHKQYESYGYKDTPAYAMHVNKGEL